MKELEMSTRVNRDEMLNTTSKTIQGECVQGIKGKSKDTTSCRESDRHKSGRGVWQKRGKKRKTELIMDR